jgi:AcrR family transcriptional regulator
MSTSKYHHGDLRGAILLAAGSLVEKQGVAALSVRAAARRAGVSHNAPYRHFPDRDSLLAALAGQGFAQLADALQGRSGREMGEAYVGFALANPQRYRLMFGGLLRLDAYPELRASAQAAHAALEQAFSGQGVDPAKAAAAAWALVHGLAMLLLDGHFQSRGDTAQFVREVLGGVRFAAAQRSA